MISFVLSRQLMRSVEGFLKTTFPVSTPVFHNIVDRQLAEDGGVLEGRFFRFSFPFDTAMDGMIH